MRVTICKFCDYACTIQGGKGAVIGMFDTIGASQFPFTQPPFHLCLELEFDEEEAGDTVNLELSLTNPDGAIVFSFEGKLPVPKNLDRKRARVFQDFRLDNLTFHQAGEHVLQLKNSGIPVAQEFLYVVQSKQNAPPV